MDPPGFGETNHMRWEGRWLTGTCIPTTAEEPVKSLGETYDCTLKDSGDQELEGWLAAVEKSGLPGKFKARIDQHGILPRTVCGVWLHTVNCGWGGVKLNDQNPPVAPGTITDELMWSHARDQHVGSRTNKQFRGSIVILLLTQWHPTLIAVLTQTVSLHWPTSCRPANHLNTLVSDERKKKSPLHWFERIKTWHIITAAVIWSQLRMLPWRHKMFNMHKKCIKSKARVVLIAPFLLMPVIDRDSIVIFSTHAHLNTHLRFAVGNDVCRHVWTVKYRVWWIVLYVRSVLFSLKSIK